jgi:hypothetical protein
LNTPTKEFREMADSVYHLLRRQGDGDEFQTRETNLTAQNLSDFVNF